MKDNEKILALLLSTLLALSLFASSVASHENQGKQGQQGQQGEKGEKGKSGRGILKTEIIDGCLWVTYSDNPETPINIGAVATGIANAVGLDFYPLPDGTYGVMAGKSKFLEKVDIPATYNLQLRGRITKNTLGQVFSWSSAVFILYTYPIFKSSWKIWGVGGRKPSFKKVSSPHKKHFQIIPSSS